MVQNEVEWVLETVKSGWPGGLYPEPPADDPGGLYRINRDEPEILETGERTKSLELTWGNAIGASLASRSPAPIGFEYDHRVETTVSVRLEGMTSRSGESGHIDSTTDMSSLVRYAQHALLTQRSYPTVDAEDDIGSVDYHSLFVENEQDLSHEHADYFRRDWDVRLVGDSILPRP